MKRTLTLLAILAAIGPAWGAEVVSSNIIGYNKLSLTESTQATTGYTMIGVPFCEVGGDALTFGTLFTDEITKDLVGGYGQEDSDTVQIWGGGKYTTYYFSAADWSEEMGDGEVDEYKNNKWLDEDGEPVSEAIDLCKGFWFKRNGDSKLTLTFPNPL